MTPIRQIDTKDWKAQMLEEFMAFSLGEEDLKLETVEVKENEISRSRLEMEELNKELFSKQREISLKINSSRWSCGQTL